MKILITGATGRLGSCICRLLQQANMAFTAVDRVPDPKADYPVDTVDLLDAEICKQLLIGVDVLGHFANHSNWYVGNAETVYSENVSMNMNLFQAAADNGCQRIVFSSSIQVVNGQRPIHDRAEHEILLPYLPIDSEMPVNPQNNYALSKVATEQMLQYFAKTRGMTTIALRYPWLLDMEWMKKAVENKGIKRGKCFDGYAYLPLYSAAEAAMKAMTTELSGYHQYFLASKDNLEQRPIAEIISEQLSHLPIKKSDDEMDSLVDCALAEEELGWSQPLSLLASFEKYGKLKDLHI